MTVQENETRITDLETDLATLRAVVESLGVVAAYCPETKPRKAAAYTNAATVLKADKA